MEKVHQVRAESVIWNPTHQLTTNSQDKCLHVNISEPVFSYKNLQLKADKICITRSLRTEFHSFCTKQALLRLIAPLLLLLLGLALAGKVGAVGTLVSLDVLELAAGISNCVELLASAAAMCGAFCFACHTVSFLLAVLLAVGVR
jgi:hypothetical protein